MPSAALKPSCVVGIELIVAVVADVAVGDASSVTGTSAGVDVVFGEISVCVQESSRVDVNSSSKTDRQKVEIIPQLYERAINHHVPRKENL
jgi:hypothetical protein